MILTLKNLLDKEIFEQYEILAGENSLNQEITSVSILETPDFENYIIENSVILTTFYPIKNEIELAESLLIALSKRKTAGIIIKLHRYIDVIPDRFLQLASVSNIPVIGLTYDANLSVLFNNILSEIQFSEFSNVSFEQSYGSVLQSVYENPTTENLMNAVKKISNVELMIENLETKKVSYSSKDVYSFYLANRNTSALIQRINEDIYYVEDVVYGVKPIYKLVFLVKQDRRNIIHNLIEIFKLLVIVVYQNKQEMMRRQSQFLMNFVSNISNNISQESFYTSARQFNWNLKLPIMLVLMHVEKDNHPSITAQIIEYSSNVIVNKWSIKNEELRYAHIEDNLLFIVNIETQLDYSSNIQTLYDLIMLTYPGLSIKIIYSKAINEFNDISNKYQILRSSIEHFRHIDIPKRVLDENDGLLLGLLRNSNPKNVQDYVSNVFRKVQTLKHSESENLLRTLYVFIENRFHIQQTAIKLFVHPNTVRYRLDQIKKYDLLPSDSESIFRIYFSLYLYFNFQLR